MSQTRQNDTSSYSDTVALIRSRTFTSSHASSFIHSHSDTTHPRTDTQEFGAKICANANGAPDISTTVKTGSLEAGKGYGTVSSETDITDDIVDTTIKSKVYIIIISRAIHVYNIIIMLNVSHISLLLVIFLLLF